MRGIAFLASLLVVPRAFTQELPVVRGVEGQPLVAQVLRLKEALDFLGSGLEPEDKARLEALRDRAPDENVVLRIQEILDPYCLAMVEINPEARVKVVRGPAEAELIEGGWRSFLVKVQNDADVNAELVVASPNAMPILHRSTNEHRARLENTLSPGHVANRFLELAMYQNRPLQKNLSGLKLEYTVVQAYAREAGRREAKIGFHVGQGTQDIGFRNSADILFEVVPAVDVTFNVTDEKGRPTMASFIITDGIESRGKGGWRPVARRLPTEDGSHEALGHRPRYLGAGETPGRHLSVALAEACHGRDSGFLLSSAGVPLPR